MLKVRKKPAEAEFGDVAVLPLTRLKEVSSFDGSKVVDFYEALKAYVLIKMYSKKVCKLPCK